MANYLVNGNTYAFEKPKTEDIENYVVDSALDASSTNPVQNKVVTKEIHDLIDDLADVARSIAELIPQVDSALDTSSTNPVQNKVIATEINRLIDDLADVSMSISEFLPVTVKARLVSIENMTISNPSTTLGEVIDSASLGHPVFIVATAEDLRTAIQVPLISYDAEDEADINAVFAVIKGTTRYSYTWDSTGIHSSYSPL